ncbi:unnamed protein product, partial [Rotaria sp. Silwood2]
MTATAFGLSLPSHFFENSTIQELINRLMIEQYYATTTDLLYILTTLFGLVGGMMTILKLVVPLFVKIVRRNKSVPTETT